MVFGLIDTVDVCCAIKMSTTEWIVKDGCVELSLLIIIPAVFTSKVDKKYPTNILLCFELAYVQAGQPALGHPGPAWLPVPYPGGEGALLLH